MLASPPNQKLVENGSDYSLPSSRWVRCVRNPQLSWWLGGSRARWSPKKGQKTKNKKTCFWFSTFYVSCSGPCLGSYGLGTPPATIKTEDFASNEPLGSSGDRNRTHFRAIFRWRGTRGLCWWSLFNRIVIQSNGTTSITCGAKWDTKAWNNPGAEMTD